MHSLENFFQRVFLFYLEIFAVLGLFCCTWAFSSCSEQELLFAAVQGLFTCRGLQRMGSRHSGFIGCGSKGLEHQLS